MSEWASSKPSANNIAPPATAAKKASKWADEDVSSGTDEEWDASSDSDSEPSVPAPPKPVRNKGITQKKIAEKEAEEAARRAEEEAMAAEEADPVAKKQREQRWTVEADMENARGLFGEAAISKSSSDDPLKIVCRTKEDFDRLASLLSSLLLASHGSKPLYSAFIETLTKSLAQPLSDVQTRKLASCLTALANEKQRAAKDAAGGKGGKKKKPGLGAVGGGGASVAAKGGRGMDVDLESYDDAELEFM